MDAATEGKVRDKTDAILLLNQAAVESLFPLDAAVEVVEQAFRAHATGEARLFPVVREPLQENALFGIKSAAWLAHGVVGLKAAGYWTANTELGLENHQATILLMNAATGQLLAVIDGNVVTRQRTAAAGAVALRTLSRSDAQAAAVLGAGAQAPAQVEALLQVRPNVRHLRVWSRNRERARGLATRFSDRLTTVTCADPSSAVRDADIVITTTASRQPLFHPADVAPGTHINAMGADTKGKRELPPSLVEHALLIVDDRNQSLAIGESQPPVRWSTQPRTIGEILVAGRSPRQTSEQITIFDSTGIAIQDLASAEWLYRKAGETGASAAIRWSYPTPAGRSLT
jgi:ornithine cyclodeaminase